MSWFENSKKLTRLRLCWADGQCRELKALKVRLELVRSAVQEVRRKREAVVLKESEDTQEYESCQQNNMNESGLWDDRDLHMNENTEKLSFISSAVSNSPDWHEPKFMCDRFQVLRRCVSNG